MVDFFVSGSGLFFLLGQLQLELLDAVLEGVGFPLEVGFFLLVGDLHGGELALEFLVFAVLLAEEVSESLHFRTQEGYLVLEFEFPVLGDRLELLFVVVSVLLDLDEVVLGGGECALDPLVLVEYLFDFLGLLPQHHVEFLEFLVLVLLARVQLRFEGTEVLPEEFVLAHEAGDFMVLAFDLPLVQLDVAFQLVEGAAVLVVEFPYFQLDSLLDFELVFFPLGR